MSDHKDFILNLKENTSISFNHKASMLYNWAVDNEDEIKWVWDYIGKMVDRAYVVESIYQNVLKDDLTGILAKTKNITDGDWFWEEEPDKFRDFTPDDMERVLSSILDALGDSLW